jgi:hypothetical protein
MAARLARTAARQTEGDGSGMWLRGARIIVTGGAGFIGSHIEALSRQIKLLGLKDNSSRR